MVDNGSTLQPPAGPSLGGPAATPTRGPLQATAYPQQLVTVAPSRAYETTAREARRLGGHRSSQ